MSGGQARLVTPPAAAASISDSSVAMYSKPGSRSRAREIDQPGTDDETARIDGAVGAVTAAAPRRSPTILPAVMKTSLRRRCRCFGSIAVLTQPPPFDVDLHRYSRAHCFSSRQ